MQSENKVNKAIVGLIKKKNSVLFDYENAVRQNKPITELYSIALEAAALEIKIAQTTNKIAPYKTVDNKLNSQGINELSAFCLLNNVLNYIGINGKDSIK
jgi:hypothetical protein